MTLDWLSTIISIAVGGISVAIAFYIKEFLQKRSDFNKFRKKIERIAGKNATILYSGTGIGQQMFKIIDIDEHGLVLKDELQTIYVPVSKLINSDVILPVDNYDTAQLEKLKRDMQRFSKALMPAMFEEMFPAMIDGFKKLFQDELLDDKSDFSMIIGMKITNLLSEEGYEIRKLDKPNRKAG
jgi:hypothetical protein